MGFLTTRSVMRSNLPATRRQTHGWNGARKAISNRLWAEINISPYFRFHNEPGVSRNDPGRPFFLATIGLRAWNAFVLLALEQAGPSFPRNGPDLTVSTRADAISSDFHRISFFSSFPPIATPTLPVCRVFSFRSSGARINVTQQ